MSFYPPSINHPLFQATTEFASFRKKLAENSVYTVQNLQRKKATPSKYKNHFKYSISRKQQPFTASKYMNQGLMYEYVPRNIQSNKSKNKILPTITNRNASLRKKKKYPYSKKKTYWKKKYWY